MRKTILMLMGLVGVFAAGIACSGLGKAPERSSEGTAVEECAGLSGQARIDCEQQHGKGK